MNLSLCLGHSKSNNRNIISNGSWVRDKEWIGQTRGPDNLRGAKTDFEPDEGKVVTHRDVVGHGGQVPARVEDDVRDPEPRPPPGEVTEADVNADFLRV